MATASAGALAVTLTADTAQFDSAMDKSAAAAERSMQRTSRAQAAAQKDSDRFIASIQRQVDTFGMTGTALMAYEARLKGVSDQAQPLIDRLNRMRDAQAAFNEVASQATTRQTAGDNLVASLQSQVDAFGKTTAEMTLQKAALLGVSDAAAPLVARLQQLAAAEQAAAAAAAEAAATKAQEAAQERAEAATLQAGLAARAQFVASLQREADAAGKSRTELLAMQAAHMGVSASAAPLIARLDEIAAAEKAAAAAATQAARAEAEAAAAERAEVAALQAGIASRSQFIAALKQQAESIGKTRSELLAMQAAQMGVSNAAAPYISSIAATEQAADHAASTTARFKREFVVLAHELSQGNYTKFGGSLMVLAEYAPYGSIAAWGGLGVAIGVVAAAVGVATAAMVVGAQEQKDFNNALQLTGNYAGITGERMTSMARSIASSTTGSVNTAREAIQALVKTGDIGPALIQPMATAVVSLGKLTGQSADEIVADFARMSDGVAKWAVEHNRQMNFLTAAQYEYIKALEDAGRKEEAEAATIELVNQRVGVLRPNLGYLQAAWRGVTEWASKAWDAMKGVGRAETTDTRIEEARQRAADYQRTYETASKMGFLGAGLAATAQKGIDSARGDEAAAQEDARMARRAAQIDAQNAATQKAGIAGAQVVEGIQQEIDKRSKATKEIEKYTVAVANMRKANDPKAPDAAQEAADIAAIREKYKDRSAEKLDNRYNDRLVALQQEGAKLDAEIRSYELYGKAIDKARVATLNLEIEQGKLRGLSPEKIANLQQFAAADDAKDKRLAEAEATAKANREFDHSIALLKSEAEAKSMNARETEIATQIARMEASGIKAGTDAYIENAASIRTWVGLKHDAMLERQLAAQALANEDEVHKLDEETRMLSLSTLERTKATAALRLYKQAQADIAANPNNEGQILDALAAKTEVLNSAIDRNYEASRRAETGIGSFFQRYTEEATNAAKNAETVSQKLVGGIEDALTGALSGKKDAFKGLVDSIISEMTRLYTSSRCWRTSSAPTGRTVGSGRASIRSLARAAARRSSRTAPQASSPDCSAPFVSGAAARARLQAMTPRPKSTPAAASSRACSVRSGWATARAPAERMPPPERPARQPPRCSSSRLPRAPHPAGLAAARR